MYINEKGPKTNLTSFIVSICTAIGALTHIGPAVNVCTHARQCRDSRIIYKPVMSFRFWILILTGIDNLLSTLNMKLN